jgi:hypothetical protein
LPSSGFLLGHSKASCSRVVSSSFQVGTLDTKPRRGSVRSTSVVNLSVDSVISSPTGSRKSLLLESKRKAILTSNLVKWHRLVVLPDGLGSLYVSLLAIFVDPV